MGILSKEIKTFDSIVVENILWDSSNILKTSYNYNTKQIFVTYHRGGVYYYNNVPDSVYEKIWECESVGRFINGVIQKEYTAVKRGLIGEDQLKEIKDEIQLLRDKEDEDDCENL